MCAPRDQRKSNDGQREQAEQDALRYQRRCFGKKRSRSAGREFAPVSRGFNSRNERYGTATVGAKRPFIRQVATTKLAVTHQIEHG